MRKILILLFAFFPLVANATGMCVHTGSYVVQLSTSRDGVSFETGNDGAWSVTFDYPTSSLNTNIVRGFASCNEVSGTINTADNGVSAVAGESTGVNCWCSMKMPLISDWVNAGVYASAAACSAACATACATAVKTNSTFRTAMFGAIW
jgi:hypothetical protein